MEVKVESPGVNAVPKMNEDKDFETLTVTVDSGAYNTVGPVKAATHFKVEPTKASQAGQHYRAANGSMIRNYGQRIVSGSNENGKKVNLPIQVADVDKVLGSVREMVNVGNRVVFDKGADGKCCSYVEHRASGRKIVIHERNGKFQFDLKIPKGKGVEAVNGVEGSADSRRRDVTVVNTGEGFPRQGTLMADLFH